MFCAIMGGFIAQMFIGVISDKMGRKIAIMLCASIGFVTMLCYAFFTPHLYLQYVLAIFLGMGIFCLYALALARANDMLQDKGRAVELGRGVLFCYSLGSLLAPLILGVLMEHYGFRGFVWFYVILLGTLILFAINKPNILNKKFKKNLGNAVIFND